MADGSLARRYARALEALGEEGDCIDRVQNDLATFEQVLGLGDGVLRGALENPGLTTVERREVLDQVLSRLDLHPHVANFLRLLVDKHRFEVLSQIHREFLVMADEHFGRVRASVVTAHAASAGIKDEIVRTLEASTGLTVLVDFSVNPALLGGLVARVGDTVYDASVRGRLDALRLALGRSAAGEA